jgi:hypothetical protein
MPSGEGERSRHQLMADSISVMWMPAMVAAARGLARILCADRERFGGHAVSLKKGSPFSDVSG